MSRMYCFVYHQRGHILKHYVQEKICDFLCPQSFYQFSFLFSSPLPIFLDLSQLLVGEVKVGTPKSVPCCNAI